MEISPAIPRKPLFFISRRFSIPRIKYSIRKVPKITILSRNEILKYIEEGKIEISPFEKDQVGPTSIDLTLGNDFRVFRKVRKIFQVKELASSK